MDERARDRLEYEATRLVEEVLKSFRSANRVQFWQRASYGFIVDVAFSVRPLRPREVGFGIGIRAEGEGSVRLSINRVFSQTTEDPEPTEDDLDGHSLVVGLASVPEAADQLLNRIVGFPPPP